MLLVSKQTLLGMLCASCDAAEQCIFKTCMYVLDCARLPVMVC